jgi:hypothetical protein
MSAVPAAALDVLGEGRLCYLSARTGHGPHVTPVVFVLEEGAVWATTARGTAKARAWKNDPTAAGLVRRGDRAVSFRGRVTMYDLLDPTTWGPGLRHRRQLVKASARFTMKNARYFAGYARDVRRLPLAWMPPARIIVSIDLDAGVVLNVEAGTVEERWGGLGSAARGRTTFRPSPTGKLPERGVYRDLRRALGRAGRGALGMFGSAGPIVLPVAWSRAGSEGAYYAVLPRPFLLLAGATPAPKAALVMDLPSAWRAATMRGILLQGEAEVFLPRNVRSGREDLLVRARRAGPPPADPAVVRLRPERAVWWKGWSSDTVERR